MSTDRSRPSVVVGVDGSPDSVPALRRALELARSAGTRVGLVLAYDAAIPTPRAYGLDPVTPARCRAVARDRLDAVLASLPEEDRKLVASTEVVAGSAGHVLVDCAAEADVLVVGSRGRHGALRGAVMGSVADYCARHAPCSVLVVRSAHRAADRAVSELTAGTAAPAR